MLKYMKRIVPLLLAASLIASLFWYIFVYDRDTIRDFLLAQARSCAQNGHFEAATWFYDISYEFSGEDENVAVDLAQIYKDIGNYTKAEYTLVSAIADGATAELYMALCQTYVEQDKLLDAVNMLDKVADPEIRAQLDALRPAAPRADFAPGFYSQYITLNFTHESGTLYVSTDGEYPSTADAPCTTPVALEGGETKLYAVAVGDNGLVSPLSVLNYTVGGVVEVVEFEDVYIEELIEEQLMFGTDTVIYSDDLWSVTELTVPSEALELNDLRHLLFLEKLSLRDRTITDLSFLEGMTHLKSLDLSGSTIDADMRILGTLPELETLTMERCSISSVAFLEGAPSLKKLDLSGNAIGNITALGSISTLQELYMADNAISDLSPLIRLSNLTHLDLSDNMISNLTHIGSNTMLTTLDVSGNRLTTIAVVQKMPGLISFRAELNYLIDCAPLASCTELQVLDISHNQLSDISMLGSLVKLTEFDFSHNTASALPAWSNSTPLVTIDGSYNQLSSLEALDKLSALNYVYMDYNPEISQIAFLADNPNMVLINVYGTKVSQAQANSCIDRSIIVNFDPT